MADHSIDRNLLFGLLALQNDFIDREALLDAFSRWIHDRSVLLGQILRDNGALKSDEYELLRALVAKHLEKFGDDPQRLSCIRTQVHQVQPNIDEMEYGAVPFRSISHSSGSPPSGHSHLYRIASYRDDADRDRGARHRRSDSEV